MDSVLDSKVNLNDYTQNITSINSSLNNKLNTGITTSGSGNAITNVTESNGNITVTKGSTFSLDNHTHDYLPLSGGTLTGDVKGKPYIGTSPSVAFISQAPDLVKGNIPQVDHWFTLCMATDSAGIENANKFGQVETAVRKTGETYTELKVFKNVTGNTSAAIRIGYDASGNIYTQAPTPATTDNSIKIVTTAYVKSNLANYVSTSGNQTIAGNKTFSGQVILTKNTDAAAGSANAVALVVGGTQAQAHLELDANEIVAKSNGTEMTTLYLQDGNACVYYSTTAMAPDITNVITLGDSGKVWKQLYAATTTISTSDERQKQQIEDIPDEVLDAWGEIEFKQFKFNDAVEEKGENARIHMGLIAQRIKEVFEKHNLDPFKYGFFCYDEWDVHEDPKDENSPVIRRENGYAIRYEEALIIEAAYQRRRLDRIEEAIKLLSK